jgi:hypothetical protein
MQQGLFLNSDDNFYLGYMIKLIDMSAKLDQFQHEGLTWTRSLEFFKQENAHLKDRLSQVVDKTSDKYFLAQAEHFQNQFIIKDEFIDELKHDVNEQVRLIRDYTKKEPLNGSLDRFETMQEKLREQMRYLEKDFAALRNEFNTYLTSQIFG